MRLTDPDFPAQPETTEPHYGAGESRSHLLRNTLIGVAIVAVLLLGGLLFAMHWVRTAAAASLPQIDGSVSIDGLSAPVTVDRDAHGVPHIRAASLDDLVFAQGFVTAQDRLFGMDLVRRHAAGRLAEILGPSLVGHDRLQRTLLIRVSAERALRQLPPGQRHLLERYAAGVNASIAAQSPHLPLEFRVLRYRPDTWTPLDSMLVTLAMFEDLTNTFPTELARESLVARLPAGLRSQLEADLFPVGSWRDHPPNAPPVPDLSVPGPLLEDIPLDESQASLSTPSPLPAHPSSLIPLPCPSCFPGSNNWVVSGANTASGKPLLANDMHLNHSVPGVWYEADLEASSPGPDEPFHAAGVTLPGVPLIVVGHNNHIAWGFTNLGGDVQDVYVESTRGAGAKAEFQMADGTWQPILEIPEIIHVHGARDVPFAVFATHHGDALTPILNPVLPTDVTAPGGHPRTLSLRWTIYDPAVPEIPTLAVNSARDWPSFLSAFSNFGGPAQNVVYADDEGHIGFHVVGKIPLRGPAQTPPPPVDPSRAPFIAPSAMNGSPQETPTIAAAPSPLNATDIQAPPTPPVPLLSGPLSPVPLVPSLAHEWSGYIPFDQLPEVFDPPGGIIATANARITADDYGYPITLNWASSYRTERILHLLASRPGLTPADMLAIQGDIYSDFNRVLAERLTYALDESLAHSEFHRSAADLRTLHAAADLLRTFKGRMTVDSAAASVVTAAHAMLWPMLLEPKLSAPPSSQPHRDEWDQLNSLYQWGERDYALEQILMHTPPRWLPPAYKNWNDFLADCVLRAVAAAKAPADLNTWRYGSLHTLDIEHPVLGQSATLRFLLGRPIGTGIVPQSGDGTTVKQVGHTFGPSERFTADLSDLSHSTLNVVLGQSGNPDSPWFLDQFPLWYRGATLPLHAPAKHTLTLEPVGSW